MKIAFCTTCRGRLPHLQRTLRQNMADNPRSLFVVLDYNSQDGLREWLREQFAREMHFGRLAVYSYPAADRFRMAHAKNMAHRCGMLEGADVLVNLDADNFTGRGFTESFEDYIERHLSDEPDSFLWAQTVPGMVRRGVSGRIVLPARTFLKTGGYDERFDTWAPDDKCLSRRLERLGCRPVQIEPQYLGAIQHTEKMRFREYPHARDCDYSTWEPKSPQSCVVNAGAIGCGVVYRNFDFAEPIAIEPLPTRIFGVGLQKTATTSLAHAFEILGFDAGHWKTPLWAKTIWREMHADRYSVTLERSQALCDLPIAMLFRELDKAYPNSKFVLTVKREDLWLESVRCHWDPAVNRFRESWDNDAWSHRCHRILYGREDFDADTMLARYRRHNAEVLDYFRERPTDLLVMNMDAGAGWRELAPFLGKPVPSVPYPRSYADY
jgi:Sulfotransferase domain